MKLEIVADVDAQFPRIEIVCSESGLVIAEIGIQPTEEPGLLLYPSAETRFFDAKALATILQQVQRFVSTAVRNSRDVDKSWGGGTGGTAWPDVVCKREVFQ